MSDISIRPATAADIPAITRIYAHAVRHGTASFESSRRTKPKWRAASARYSTAVIRIWWRKSIGAVVGYAYAGPYRTRPAYRFTVENSIYVAPQAHRRGIGRVLLDRLIAECAARNYRLMIAVIGDSAQTPSIELHRAAGFKMVGAFEAVGYKFDRWLDSVLMQRPLGKGSSAPP
jgi:phosphinothricin acetyltransferase